MYIFKVCKRILVHELFPRVLRMPISGKTLLKFPSLKWLLKLHEVNYNCVGWDKRSVPNIFLYRVSSCKKMIFHSETRKDLGRPECCFCWVRHERLNPAYKNLFMDTYKGVSSIRECIYSKFVSGLWFMNLFF